MKKTLIPICIFMLFISLSVFAVDTVMTTASVYPQTLTPGSEGYIQFSITNTGSNTITDMRILSAVAENPIIVQNPSIQNLGSLNPGSSYSTNLKFSVPPSTSSGYYVAKITIEVCYGVYCKNYIQNTIISVQAPNLVEIKAIDPYEIKIGEGKEFNFTIQNNGDSDITNVILTIYDPSQSIISLGSTNRVYIPKIEAHKSSSVSAFLAVDPNAKSGYHNIYITVQYTDQKGSIQFVNLSAGIRISGIYKFIFSKESQDIIEQGKSGTVSIRVANAGTQDAKFLTEKIIINSTEISVTPSIVYVGTLKSDDFDTEKYIIYTNPTVKPGYYNATMIIEYRDEFGSQYSETYTFNIFISQSSAILNTLKNIIIILTFGIVIFFIYKMKFKKKRHD